MKRALKMNKKIPIEQGIYAVVLGALVVFRIFWQDDLSLYINIANYISMGIALMGTWLAACESKENDEQLKFCKGVLIIILLIMTAFGFYVVAANSNIPSAANDVFTLIALFLCICDEIAKKAIVCFFSLTEKQEE